MTTDFHVEWELTPDVIRSVSDLNPTNPFCTSEYINFRIRCGDQPLLLLVSDNGKIDKACAAFITSGRLHTQLRIESLPKISREHIFWDGLLNLCRKAYVTDLSIGTFASRDVEIPSLGRRMIQKKRREYVLDLDVESPFRGMRKGHAYEIKRAHKAGVVMHRSTSMEACSQHIELINASMERRIQRGERVGHIKGTSGIFGLAQGGAAELFQVKRDTEVLASNLILLAPRAGYNHTQGTSAAGMRCGAAHFLIYEIASALREEGRSTFNLGGTDQFGSGLERFKTGFGADINQVPLVAAEIKYQGICQRFISLAFDSLGKGAPPVVNS